MLSVVFQILTGAKKKAHGHAVIFACVYFVSVLFSVRKCPSWLSCLSSEMSYMDEVKRETLLTWTTIWIAFIYQL